MVRSRHLFLRSRFELAVTMQNILPKGAREQNILPKGAREFQVLLFAMLLCCLPFGFIYVPLFLFAKLTSGVWRYGWPGLKDVKIEFCDWLANLLSAVAKPMDDDDDDNDEVAWEGRVLDLERRTKRALKDVKKDVKEEFEARIGKLEKKIDQVLKLLVRK